jgi:hypothetical protein
VVTSALIVVCLSESRRCTSSEQFGSVAYSGGGGGRTGMSD